ncbi:MAG: peptide MFS transporter [Porphyromonadaceae bacterium]|nr:peptide MFS transporter [Porphyromonadaceae bacterium]
MFKGHPKGLIIASIANMGERFGFYTMMAILLLFLQAKFGLDPIEAGKIYSTFYFLIYVLALVGGIVADRWLGLGKTIFSGIILMFIGYMVISIPGTGMYPVLGGLLVIALGNGLFKGNLQALVGNLYDDPKYSHLRDRAFSIFYMCINVGAIFAPHAATGIRNWWLTTHGLAYNGALPKMCHELINGNLADTAVMQNLANEVSGSQVTDLTAFATTYLDVFNTGYHFAFAIAAGSMLLSMLVYTFCKKYLAHGDVTAVQQATAAAANGVKIEKMPWIEEKKRLLALGFVFLIVIFFWMSFHQNGVTLTLFARDYTATHVGPGTSLIFNIFSLMGIAVGVGGLIIAFSKVKLLNRILGGAAFIAGAAIAVNYYNEFAAANGSPISPEIFQSFNPLFVVTLTPLIVGFFAWLNKRGIEPSAPRKIGIGMFLAAGSFLIMIIGSLGLVAPKDLIEGTDAERISAYWLIATYFSLTISELFLSPMGISFVSKVAPPRFKGLMQGGWLCATALGNQLLFIGTIIWSKAEIWQVWIFFTICCVISGSIIFALMKRLEAVAK